MTPELSKGRRRLVLAVVALALMMVVSAVSGLNVALPDLSAATGASQTQVIWIVDAYTLVFVGFLLPAGALGDRYGRKGTLLVGLSVFGAAAAAALFVSSPGTLIALRGAMGLGAAAVMPTTLSIITTSFPPAERGRAVGVWVGVAGGGAVLGLLASGALLEFFAWNSFFGLNVVLAAVALIGTLLFIPTSRDACAPRLDPLGALLSLLAAVGIVFGIIEGPDRGWGDTLTIAGFVIGGLALAAFIGWELRRTEPLLDVRLFRLKGFSAGSGVIMVQFFGSFGLFFIILQYLQYVADLSPFRAAICLIPLPMFVVPTARNAPKVAARLGTNRVLPLGLILSASGLAVMTTLGAHFVYWHLAVGLALFGAGMGLAGTPSTTAIVSCLPAVKQGVGSAMNDLSRELGSALGIAVLGSTLSSAYRSHVTGATTGLPERAATGAQSSIAFVKNASGHLAQYGPKGQHLLDAAQRSFVDAAHTAFLTAIVVLLAGAVFAAIRAPRKGDAEVAPHEEFAVTGV
ncbi:MFS transporter [Catenulispora pinisilvae]|uniref:MFS transporter n=1 Tax=Catenulispora pinisilvae TaxID=2705253 RepID=UPI001891DECC|nr:MFS transporter [Catenulispora pinisilvae]